MTHPAFFWGFCRLMDELEAGARREVPDRTGRTAIERAAGGEADVRIREGRRIEDVARTVA